MKPKGLAQVVKVFGILFRCARLVCGGPTLRAATHGDPLQHAVDAHSAVADLQRKYVKCLSQNALQNSQKLTFFLLFASHTPFMRN